MAPPSLEITVINAPILLLVLMDDGTVEEQTRYRDKKRLTDDHGLNIDAISSNP